MEEYDSYFITTKIIQNIPRVYECGGYSKRGKAIIAVFQTFNKKYHVDSVDFSEDLKMLEYAFKLQQYDVEVWNDAEDMKKVNFLQNLNSAAKDPIHKDSESFAIIILTHGKKRGMFLAYDDEFTMEDVYGNFTADKCEALANKPKLFIFHACRGKGKSRGAFASGWFIETNLKGVSIPSKADLLLVFSTFDGKVAFGGGQTGSPFIYAFKKVLEDDYMKKDEDKEEILELMTNVNRMTACFTWKDNYSENVAKQQPVHMCTLLSQYYLRKKPENATS